MNVRTYKLKYMFVSRILKCAPTGSVTTTPGIVCKPTSVSAPAGRLGGRLATLMYKTNARVLRNAKQVLYFQYIPCNY